MLTNLAYTHPHRRRRRRSPRECKYDRNIILKKRLLILNCSKLLVLSESFLIFYSKYLDAMIKLTDSQPIDIEVLGLAPIYLKKLKQYGITQMGQLFSCHNNRLLAAIKTLDRNTLWQQMADFLDSL